MQWLMKANALLRTSLPAQWLELCPPMHRSHSQLVREDPTWPKHQNIKQKEYCNKFSIDLKIVHIRKKKSVKKTVNTLVDF